jgi:hypothetical protein
MAERFRDLNREQLIGLLGKSGEKSGLSEDELNEVLARLYTPWLIKDAPRELSLEAIDSMGYLSLVDLLGPSGQSSGLTEEMFNRVLKRLQQLGELDRVFGIKLRQVEQSTWGPSIRGWDCGDSGFDD